MFVHRVLLPLLAAVCLLTRAFAASPHREAVTFTYTGNVGFGNSVFVVGDHPDVGGGDVTRAVKLRYTAGNVWTGLIAVQAGTALSYRFISRATATDRWGDPANAVNLSGTLSRTIPAQPAAPYRGKTIYYLSSWPQANLFFKNVAGGWTETPMTRVGAGRAAGEALWKLANAGEAGESLEFVFHDGNTGWDNPPGGGNYLTANDVFHVQDSNVFPYPPPAVVSAPQIETLRVESTASNIAGRSVRVLLPRGYAQNTGKRYPVLYLHDGQNVFDPGGPFGSWSADATATREIAQGRVRETILVAIDNDGANRIPEYQPPGDSYQNTPGRADAYARFVVDNVRPAIDTAYRTLNDPANTLTLGSSMGGLVSLYLGRETGVFGKIAVMSPALWIAPNYLANVAAGTRKPLRAYLDMGTAEGASYWDDCQNLYDVHLAQGHAANDDLRFVAGIGQAHNEAAWAARLPEVLRFLLPAGEEPPVLAQREHPPKLTLTRPDPVTGRASLAYTSLFGFAYAVEGSTDLRNWTPVQTTAVETLPWAARNVDVPGTGQGFWRLRYPLPP